MNYLPDTHLLVWAAQEPFRLPREVAALFENREKTFLFSVVSIWEVAIKKVRRPAEFSFEIRALREGLLEHGFAELPVTGAHVLATEELEPIHTDPFDRLLLAQAICENLVLITADRNIARYPGPIWRV